MFISYPGSGFFSIPASGYGSRIQGLKSTGSRIRIRNTGLFNLLSQYQLRFGNDVCTTCADDARTGVRSLVLHELLDGIPLHQDHGRGRQPDDRVPRGLQVPYTCAIQGSCPSRSGNFYFTIIYWRKHIPLEQSKDDVHFFLKKGISLFMQYDLYGPVRNVFDAGRSITWGSGGGGGLVGAGNREFLGPLKCHLGPRKLFCPLKFSYRTANAP